MIEPLPALVQLKCRETWYKQFAGVRTDAFVTLFCDGHKTASDLSLIHIYPLVQKIVQAYDDYETKKKTGEKERKTAKAPGGRKGRYDDSY